MVADASVVVALLLTPAGLEGRVLAAAEWLAVPDLLDLEVAQVLRRRVMAGVLSPGHAETALGRLRELPAARHQHGRLLSRAWELRHNLTIYDACYVALAEALAVPLVTADIAMADVPGVRCEVRVVGAVGSP